MSVKRIDIPVTEAAIRELKVGDEVGLYGTLVTGRDAAHKLMHEEHPEWLKPLLANAVIYHCGPVVKKIADGPSGKAKDATWKVVAAGPTTSIREEPYQADVIGHYGLRGVIGKGGMGAKTAAACKEFGAVYFHAVGGAAVALAESIKEVVTVHLYDELGPPEAFWVLRVEDFRAVVTIDAHGHSLHTSIADESRAAAEKFFG
ncbi:MAG: FumA C-terminus/TtdB family hydratase beta subunit [Polyangiaceae bacterium]